MIQWLEQEEGFCEGTFKSKFFRDDENGDELSIGVQSPKLSECAEKCVEAFNSLTASQISKICEEIIRCAQECGGKEFESYGMDNALDILNHCWFTTLYVNMLSREDKNAYVVEGEGEWGHEIGFAVENDEVIYVGSNYFSCMKKGHVNC